MGDFRKKIAQKLLKLHKRCYTFCVTPKVKSKNRTLPRQRPIHNEIPCGNGGYSVIIKRRHVTLDIRKFHKPPPFNITMVLHSPQGESQTTPSRSAS